MESPFVLGISDPIDSWSSALQKHAVPPGTALTDSIDHSGPGFIVRGCAAQIIVCHSRAPRQALGLCLPMLLFFTRVKPSAKQVTLEYLSFDLVILVLTPSDLCRGCNCN